MAYNLPPPWDPGYALPDNVRDEGLERRGFVTKQMPRGTYDQPDVGTGGYAVPQYVMDEGYGQGTFTTKWEPRGQYDGGRIPPWLNQRPRVIAEKKIRGRTRDTTIAFPMAVTKYGNGSAIAMSGVDDLPANFANYGKRAAAVILSRVQSLPMDKRKVALKQIMDSMDPTLWDRTAKLSRQNLAAGMSAAQALREGLALALGSGIAAELIQVGISRRAPQRRSLLGLGCYGSQGLGEVPSVATMMLQTSLIQPTVGPLTCLRPGFTWENGAWRRLMAGETTQNPGPASGVTGCKTVAETQATKPVQEAVVDGLPVTLAGQPLVTSRFMGLTPAQKATLKAMLESAGMPWTSDPNYLARPTWEGIKIDPNVLMGNVMIKNVTRPAGHSLYFKGYAGGDFNLWLVPTRGVIDTLKAISEGTPIIGPIIKEIHDKTEGLACELVSKQSTQQVAGGAAGAGPYGAAAAAGVAIVASQCQQPKPPDPGGAPPPAASSSMLPLALIGGGVVLAAVLLMRKKTP